AEPSGASAVERQAARGGGGVDETGQRRFERRLMAHVRVMTVSAGDFEEGRFGARGGQRARNLAAFVRRIAPIAREREYPVACRAALEGVGEAPAKIGSEIEAVHGAGEVEIRIRVEAIDVAGALLLSHGVVGAFGVEG